MVWLFGALLVSIATAVSTIDRPALATAHASRFRVATFNIHKGADVQGRYDLERTIEAIAGFDADLVGVQEAMRNDPGLDCDDQPALIADGLTRLTGRSWSYVFARAWMAGDRECLGLGRGDGPAMEGLALFAPSRLIGAATLRLSAGRIGLMARPAWMPEVAVVLTHLSANQRNQTDRVREIQTLLPWLERRNAAIVMGDLNALPRAAELAPILLRYRDAWTDGAERGVAKGVDSGATRPGRRGTRIDYVFYAADAGLVLESVDVVDTSTREFAEASDHRPVVATFRREARVEP